jgi:carboxypeptidase family protein
MKSGFVLLGLMAAVVSSAQAQDGGRKVSGRVFDDSTGCPLRGVKLAVSGAALHVLSDANGRYRMMNPPAAPFTLEASLRGWGTEYSANLLVSDSSARVDFSLARAQADSATGTVYPRKACRLEPVDSGVKR